MIYDVIIIGFGKAGKTLAASLAKQNKKIALIEKSEKMYGGTCINVGCIPTKFLREKAHQVANEERGFDEKAEAYKRAIEDKNTLVTMLRGKNYDKLNQFENITIYHGEASFESENKVNVEMQDEKIVLEGNQIFINTGATPNTPPIEGIQGNAYVHTSETLLENRNLPKQLCIIGAGYIGLEIASMYHNFGSEVTVIQRDEGFLPKEDKDIADSIKEIMTKKGICFELGVQNIRVEENEVVFTKNNIEYRKEADAILVATGRKPNTMGLNLDSIGVDMDARGAIVVDEHLHTSVPNIWAMGDVTGEAQYTYLSLDDYRIIEGALSVGESAVNKVPYTRQTRKNIPYSVFLDTPYARVGMNEKEAKERNIPIRVLKMPVAAIPKAQVLKRTEGMLKAIIHKDTDKILGVMLLCEESYEMINVVKMAMDYNADASQLKNQIFTHPTMTEALNDLFSM